MRWSLQIIFVSIAALWFRGAWAQAQSLSPEVVWAMPTSARIKCVTTVPGKMTVEYGKTPALGTASPPEWRDWPDTDVTRHYVNLVGLEPDTTYYYRVRVTLSGGGDLSSEVLTFRTFRSFTKLLPTVHYASYIIGSDWTESDPNKPYHAWNGQHYDLHIAFHYLNAEVLRNLAPNAVIIRYDNITNNYALAAREQHSHWMDWAEQQGISYEHIALHYSVDSKISQTKRVDDRRFEAIHVFDGTLIQRIDHAFGQFPNVVGGWVEIGLALRFDVVYITALVTPASGGYDGVWEYCSGVDAEGKPASWTPLTIVEDTTIVGGQKFAQPGYVRFVPPKERSEWKRARIRRFGTWLETWNKGFLIRFRVTQTGTTAPKVPHVCEELPSDTILNEDFVKLDTDGKEIIPGWDASWETNPSNNGDPEYNPNPPADGGVGVARSARFKWWSRPWYYSPQDLRFLTNVFDSYYAQWLADAWLPYIFQTYPWLDGWYCDNYGFTQPHTPVEPTTLNYIEIGVFDKTQYTIGMGEIMERCSIKATSLGKVTCANNGIWLTDGDRWDVPRFISEPFRLWMHFAPAIMNREMSTTFTYTYHKTTNLYSTFATYVCEMAYHVARGYYGVPMYMYTQCTRGLEGKNTEEWWHREKLMALALHLLVKDATDQYLFFNVWNSNCYYGEYLTSTDPRSANIYYVAGIPKQKAYYVDAATYDFGSPVTTVEPPYTQWVGYPSSWYPGVIPGLFVMHFTNQAPTYDAGGNFIGNTSQAFYFARKYTGALVVWRTGNCTVYDERSINEYTELDLGASYYRLRADGSIDTAPVTKLNLRHQEAAILIPAGQASMPNIQLTLSVDKQNPKPLDVVTVVVSIKNVGQETLSGIVVNLPLFTDTTFVRGSLRLNGVALSDPSSPDRVEIIVPSILAGHVALAQFQYIIKPRE